MNNTQIASTIKALCKERQITVKQLLEICDINKGFIYGLEKENNTPSVDKLLKIAEFFSCSVDYLLGRGVADKMGERFVHPLTDELTDSDPDRRLLLENYEKLNSRGRDKLTDYSFDLVGNEKYTQADPLPASKEA